MKTKKDIKTQVKSGIKTISSIAVGYGVGELMGYILKDFQPNTKGVKKVFVKIGALALTGMVVKSACDYVEGEIDELFDTTDEVITMLAEETEEKEADAE